MAPPDAFRRDSLAYSPSVPVGFVIALCVFLGVLTGVLSAMFGVGGAVISTPGIRVLGATPIEGIGSTLPSVLPSAIAGAMRYHRERLVRWSVVAKVAPWGCAASVAGAVASVHFPGKGHVQMLLTAGLVLFTAYRASRPPRTPVPVATGADGARTTARTLTHAPQPTAAPTAAPTTAAPPRLTLPTFACAVIGLGAGALSGFLGVGGGIFMAPTFRGWLKLPLKETVATSLACVGLIAIPSSLTHIYEGTVNWVYALPLCLGVVPGARLGAHFAIQASDRHLRFALGSILGTVGLGYGIAELIALLK